MSLHNPKEIDRCKRIAAKMTMPAGAVDDYGHREGPCIIEYRDWSWYEHPVRRSRSCLGCRHVRYDEYDQAKCAHPTFLRMYGVHQCVAEQSRLRRFLICPQLCPVLVESFVRGWPEQPDPQPLPKRSPEYLLDPAEVFAIPQRKRWYDE